MGSERPLSRQFWLGDVDPRPIALFRIAYAAILLADWADRLRDFHTFYTDRGMVPRVVLSSGGLLRLFHLVGSPVGVGALWAVAFAASLALLLGWYTRLAAVASFMLLASIQARNPLILDGADVALRVFGFWLMFVDSGACFSLDTRLGGRARPDRIPAGPVRALQLQVAIIYLFAAAGKSGETWRDGSAVFFALSGEFARPLGRLLTHAPALCRIAARLTLALEWTFPVAVFAGPRARAVVLVGTAALHLAIFSTLRLGWFPWTMLVANLVFLLPAWLDGGIARLRAWGGRFAAGQVREARPEQRGETSADIDRHRHRSPRREAAVLALLMVLVGMLTVSLAAPGRFVRGEEVLGRLGLDQSWKLFAPDPPRITTEWEAHGTLVDGTSIALLPDSAPQILTPDPIVFSRWYKLRASLLVYRNRNLSWVAAYLCRRWNSDHPDRALAEYELVLHAQPIARPGEPVGVESVQPLLRQSCR